MWGGGRFLRERKKFKRRSAAGERFGLIRGRARGSEFLEKKITYIYEKKNEKKKIKMDKKKDTCSCKVSF